MSGRPSAATPPSPRATPTPPVLAPVSSEPVPPVPAAVDPAAMKVSARNTTAIPKAQAVATQLTDLKYQVTIDRTSNGAAKASSSIVYPKRQLEAAKQLGAAVGIPETNLDEATTNATTFEVVIGLDFPGLNSTAPSKSPTKQGSTKPAPQTTPAPTQAAAPPPESVMQTTADDASCIG